MNEEVREAIKALREGAPELWAKLVAEHAHYNCAVAWCLAAASLLAAAVSAWFLSRHDWKGVSPDSDWFIPGFFSSIFAVAMGGASSSYFLSLMQPNIEFLRMLR